MSSIPGLPTQGSNVTVLITRVHLHPHCMFVEFWGKFSQERTADYECLAKDIQSPGYTFQEFEGNPCDQCLVQINDTWYRCRIVSRNGSKYSVYLFDKGMTFGTTSSKLAWGKKEYFQLPPEVEFCVLANLLPLLPENRWSPVALEFLKSLCGKSVKADVQDVLVPHRMFLLHIPCIATQMYEMGFAKKLSSDRFRDFVLLSLQSRSGAQVSPETQFISKGAGERLHKRELFLYPEVPAGTVETVIVTEVRNPQQVYCQLKVFSQELKKISEQLKLSCEGRLMSCIVGPEMIGFPCATRGCDGRWYRSVLQQVFPANKVVEVLNVDYGTKQFVQVENVRPLATEFFRMPVVTYICSLHGITDKGVGWTSSQIDFLRNLLLCKTVIAKFEYQSISEGVNYVTLFGDENTNINNLFGSKESCLLECEKTLEDYAIHSLAYSCQSSAQKERYSIHQRRMLYPGKTGEEKEVKGLAEKLPAEELSLNSSHVAVVHHVSSPSEFWINIRTLPDKFKKLPRLALKCALAGVRPKDGRWSESACEFFIKAVTDKVLSIHVTARHNDCYVVQITNRESQDERDIGTLMCSSGLAERTETQTQPKFKMSIQPASMPSTQLPDGRHSGVYRNNGMSFQTQNTVGITNSERILPAFKEHMFPIGSVLDVSVSYITSPNDFWCQLVQNAAHLKLLMHDIQARYAGSEFQPFVETACVARHPDNGMWYRALVIHKHETPHVDVLFVDYGQTETVSLYDLRRISPEFLTLQGQAFRCSLLNPVDPTSAVNEWSDEATARFHDFVESASSNFVILKCTIYAVMYSEQKIVFNIVDLETPFESVCTSMINLFKSAPPKKSSGPSFRLDTYYYSTHNVKTGTEEQVTVTCVNNVSQFYCQLERNAHVIHDLKIKVSNLCCQLENVKLPAVFGTLCFAKYTDGKWYRGQIKATKPAVLVHFVDYGDTIEVDKSDLLPVPREASDIMSVPVQALVCSLSDLPANVPIEMNSWFESNATDCKFRALVVAREPDGKLLVELYHGNTQINSKIKKMFQIEMHKEELVIYHGRKTSEVAKHAQKTPKAAPQQNPEREDQTKDIKISFSAPKPAHQMRAEPKPVDTNVQCAPQVSHQKVKAASLELYKSPHQRLSCGRTQSNIGNGFKPKSAHVELKKGSLPTDTKELIKSKLPGTGSRKEMNVEELPKVTDLPTNSVTLGMEADVYVSHCNSPLSFYVQLVSEEDKIYAIAEKLNYPKSTLMTNDLKYLKPGDLVQAEFADDSSWYRAVVREVHANTMALVEFVDFGNTAMTPISKIGRLNKSFLELPAYSTHCMLSSAVDLNKDEVCNQEVVSAFKENIGGTGEKMLKCRFIRRSGSLWEVSLEENGVNVLCTAPTSHSTNGSQIFSETVEQPEEKPGQNCDTIHVPDNLHLPHYHPQEILEGQQLEVYITSITDAQTIWCQRSDSEELDQITSTVSEVVAAGKCKSVNPGSLSPGNPCIALFSDDNLFYRAEVITKDGDDLCVLFVDYGNMSHVNIADVREIPPYLVETPPQAFLCEIEGFDSSCGSWNSGAVDELSTLTTEKLLQLTVTRVERNEKTKCFVRMECDGRTINEVMKTWWNSTKTETEPARVGLHSSYEPPLQRDSAVKEAALLKDQLECPEGPGDALAGAHPQSHHVEEQFSDELVELQTADEVKLRSSSKASETYEDSVDFETLAESPIEEKVQNLLECNKAVGVPTTLIYQTEYKDPLPCDSGIEETLTSPLDDKNDQGIFTLRGDTVGETDKGSEVEVASVLDTVGTDDLISPLHEKLKDPPDVLELQTTDLEEENTWEDMGSSFDIISSNDTEMTVVRDSSGTTSKTTVKLVPREAVGPRKSTDLHETNETEMTSRDLMQFDTALVLPSLELPVQQLCNAPTDQDVEGGVDILQEEMNSAEAEETVTHHEDSYSALFTDAVTAADEPEDHTLPSPDTGDDVQEVTCTVEEACLTDVCTDPKELSDDSEVTSAGDERLRSVTAEETVLNKSLEARSQHEMEFGQLSPLEETTSNESNSVSEDESSALDEEELSALLSDTDLDMGSLLEQMAKICPNCRDLKAKADTEDSEPAVHTPPQQKEVIVLENNSCPFEPSLYVHV
uniref:Tudor domain-containing protein n=1 Tax=Anabas testudineus TaxID=64144 RepID=A0AAQ6IAV5_ANATE